MGFVERGWLGVGGAWAGDAGYRFDSLIVNLASAKGAMVQEAWTDGSPAAKAGVKEGDVITAVNGDAVKNSRDLARKIGALRAGHQGRRSASCATANRRASRSRCKQMPDDKQAKADTGAQKSDGDDVPHLGLTLGPGRRGRRRRRQGTCGHRRRSRQRRRRARPANPATSSSTSAASRSAASARCARCWPMRKATAAQTC